MRKLAISEVLAAVNLLVVIILLLPLVPILHPVVTATQFVIIPALLAATVAFAVKDSLHSKTRLHSLAALVMAFPVGFIFCVWQGWIEP